MTGDETGKQDPNSAVSVSMTGNETLYHPCVLLPSIVINYVEEEGKEEGDP